MRALRLLAAAGFKINLCKCAFLVARAVVLGMSISAAECALGDKSLKRWVGQRLPRNLAELQSVMGKLVWASAFIPGFKEAVRLIEALLVRSARTWDESCIAALNRLVALLFQRLKLGLMAPELPTELHAGYTAHALQAILLQR